MVRVLHHLCVMVHVTHYNVHNTEEEEDNLLKSITS